MTNFDAIIVGGRVAGAATAVRLRNKGLKVLVLDKADGPSDVLSTHFMNPRGMAYLHSLGVREEVLKVTPSFHYFDVSVDGLSLGGELSLPELKKRMGKVHPREEFALSSAYACIRRPVLDGSLQNKAIALGVEFKRGATVRALTECDDKTLDVTYEENGQCTTVKAKVVLGADGRHSTVARLLSLKKQEERVACTFACYTYYEGITLPHAVMKKRDRLSVAVVPTSFGKTMVLVFGPHLFFDAFKENLQANFEKAIQRIDSSLFQIVQAGKRCEDFRATVDQSSYLRERPSANAALLGDAHCFKDQCTANGMTHALRDAFLVSEELHLAFTGKKSIPEALREFEDRRHLDLFKFYEFTCSQAEMNPLRADEERLYQAIAASQEERNHFIGLYFDVVGVRDFFKQKRIERLVEGRSLVPQTEEQLGAKYFNPFQDDLPQLELEQTCFDYAPLAGTDLLHRTDAYFDFYRRRNQTNTFQYSRTLHRFPGTETTLSDDANRVINGINFASQDYLGLGQDPEIYEAAQRALQEYGPHSAGSPMVIGNTLLSKQLEEELKKLTGKKHVILFPTGYAAGMGSLLGIIKPEDHIVMDRLSHACLQQGARAATRKIHRFPHLDADSARAELKHIRSYDSKNAILLMTEGLFSMDADSPDLRRFQEIAKEFDAYLFVDVAHDLGSTGPNGTGQIGTQGMYGKIDFVMGSFSKTFASNGGFLATDSESLLHYLRMYSTPHLFSNALSPIQASVALKVAQIIQSPKGESLRQKLMDVVNHLRKVLIHEGLIVLGEPSPIIPVMIGSEAMARQSHQKMTEHQMAAMIIEYPLVPLGAARYRLQVMASHTHAQAASFAQTIAKIQRELTQVKSAPRHSGAVHVQV